MVKSFFTSKTYFNIKDLLIFIGVYFLINIAVSIPFIVGGTTTASESQDSSVISGLNLLIMYTITNVLTLIYLKWYRKRRTSTPEDKLPLENIYKIGKFSPLTVLWGVILIIASNIVLEPIIAPFDSSYNEIVKLLKNSGIYGMVSVVFIAPILEELIFRGVILSDIKRYYGSLVAIFVSALTFGAIHLNLAQLFPAFIAAIIMGYIYLKTNSICAVIFLHFLNNSISYIITLFSTEDYSQILFKDLITNDYTYYTIYSISAILTILMLVKVVVTCKEMDKIELSNSSEKEEEKSKY
ncbi:MAG: CPBP family intramembrane glutamic endopeptidase [Rikenellaceae bacterium]